MPALPQEDLAALASRRYIDAMEWLIGADGRYVKLTAEQALQIDLRATVEDLVSALDGIREAIQASRAAIADSHRLRRRRQSSLRLVSAHD
jgi:hypothetical protein